MHLASYLYAEAGNELFIITLRHDATFTIDPMGNLVSHIFSMATL